MLKKRLIMIFLLLQYLYSFAQPTIEWQKCLGGTGFDRPAFLHSYKDMIQQTSDKGFIIAGTSTSNNGDVTGHHGSNISEDYWIVKTDSIGNIQWQKSLGGTQMDGANSIQQTSDGGYIAGGFVWSTDGNVTGNHGNTDYWIVKLDNVGNIQWQKCLGGGYISGTSSGYDQAYSIKQALDGGYIIAGNSNSGNGDVTGLHVASWYYSDYWIVKLNSTGDLIWQKCLGGFLDEEAHSIALSSDSGIVVVGKTRSNDGDVTGNHDNTGNSDDYWVLKLNSSGNTIWQKCYGGTMNDSPSSISSTSDGGFIISGRTSSNDGDISGHQTPYSGGWIIKIDSVGNLKWQKCLSGTTSTAIQTLDGGYLISGTVAPNDSNVVSEYFWMVKLDSAHNFQWHTCDGPNYGGYCSSGIQTSDGKYVFIGSAYSNGGDVSGCHGGEDIWLVKLSEINVIKSHINEICSQCNGSISVNASGGTPPYSYFWNTGATTDTISNLCHGTYTVTVVDALGHIGFCSETIINKTINITMTQTGASCIGCYNGSATLHPTGGHGSYNYFWQGFSDTTSTIHGLPIGWVVGCVQDTTGCIECDSIEITISTDIMEADYNEMNIQINPNPVVTTTIISWYQVNNATITIKLYDIVGKELTLLNEHSFNKGINSFTLNLKDDLKNGLYFIKIASENFIGIKKLLIQK